MHLGLEGCEGAGEDSLGVPGVQHKPNRNARLGLIHNEECGEPKLHHATQTGGEGQQRQQRQDQRP